VLTTTVDEILHSCHEELARRGCSSGDPVLDQSCHDVDLFLINDLLNFFVGRSDNLGVFAMVDLLNEQKITAVKDLAEDISLGRLKRDRERQSRRPDDPLSGDRLQPSGSLQGPSPF
jgi:hypothetical protein